MAEFMDKGIKDIAPDIGAIRLRIVKPLTDADIAAARKG